MRLGFDFEHFIVENLLLDSLLASHNIHEAVVIMNSISYIFQKKLNQFIGAKRTLGNFVICRG